MFSAKDFGKMARLRSTVKLVTLVGAVGISMHSLAGLSVEEVAKLGLTGSEFTPAGAIRAGNSDGSIPEWRYEPPKAPAGYKPGMFHLDPFAGDTVLFTITAANYKEYADKLTSGQQKMFETFPSYKMNIYPSRRSAVYPEYVYKAALENAPRAEIVTDQKGNVAFKDAVISWAFPIPKNGNEALMNHSTRPHYPWHSTWSNVLVTTSSGSYEVSKFLFNHSWPYNFPENNVATYDPTAQDSYYRYVAYFISPPKTAGQVGLIQSPAAPINKGLVTYLYNPGLRRVKMAPEIGYDYPKAGSDGLFTVDQFFGYLGAVDRYEWTLEGRMEKYVPYNAYKLHSGDVKIKDMVTDNGLLNQDLNRYELHRVWKVVGTLRAGQRHIYQKRVMYLDEDTWWLVAADYYDARGELWRTYEQQLVNWYDVGFMASTLEIQTDMQAGRMFMVDVDNEDKVPDVNWRVKDEYFTPASIRREGMR